MLEFPDHFGLFLLRKIRTEAGQGDAPGP